MNSKRTITVFGANGRVGALVVHLLLKRGYRVRAFVHSANQELKDPNITYIHGDVADKDSVAEALNGADAVISALGSWGTKNKNILTVGMKTIVPLMEEMKVKRIVTLTGADAWTPDQYNAWRHFTLVQKLFGLMNKRPVLVAYLSHRLFLTVAGKILRDGEEHMRILSKSQLDWTTIRSPVMNNRGVNSYVLAMRYPLPWQTVNRAGVARALADEIEVDMRYRTAPYISRS